MKISNQFYGKYQLFSTFHGYDMEF